MAARKPMPTSGGKWYADEIDHNGVFTKVWVQDKGIDQYTFLGPYATEAEAKQAATGIVGTKTLKGWRGLEAMLEVGTSVSVPNPLSGVDSIATDLTKAGLWVEKKSNWIRILKVGVGLILIIGGLTHLTNTEAQITKLAEKAGASALIL